MTKWQVLLLSIQKQKVDPVEFTAGQRHSTSKSRRGAEGVPHVGVAVEKLPEPLSLVGLCSAL